MVYDKRENPLAQKITVGKLGGTARSFFAKVMAAKETPSQCTKFLCIETGFFTTNAMSKTRVNIF